MVQHIARKRPWRAAAHTEEIMAKKKAAGRERGLVVGYLERVSSTAFEHFSDVITELLGGKNGIYALYRNNNLYYVGLATDLRKRVRHHLRDRHRGKWNYFSLYLVRSERHLRDLESLAIRIADPRGNRTRGKPRGAKDLRRLFKRKMTEQALGEIGGIFAGAGTTRIPQGAKGKRVKKPPAGPSGTKAGKHHRSRKGVPLKGLLKNKRLRGTYRGQDRLAWVLPSGRIKLKETGEIYDSPSGAAGAIRRGSINGWAFWCYLNDSGEWVPLSTVRNRSAR